MAQNWIVQVQLCQPRVSEVYCLFFTKIDVGQKFLLFILGPIQILHLNLISNGYVGFSFFEVALIQYIYFISV